MPFKRTWDSSCPKVYDTWQTGDVTWVIQDLPPEDDEEALKLLEVNMCPDETLCTICGLVNEPESMRGMLDFWRVYLSKRMSLACYADIGGKRELVALNVCYVTCADEEHDDEIVGERWQNVFNALVYAESKVDSFKYLGLDKVLFAVGLVVKREYRGSKLGARMLAAREPLSKPFGIKGTSTVFTGVASQNLATRCGFTTALTVPIKELAESGLNYPTDDERAIKLMVKKYE